MMMENVYPNKKPDIRQPNRELRDDPQRLDTQEPRRNPRLVFSDPDRFFRDLLMEQQEQS